MKSDKYSQSPGLLQAKFTAELVKWRLVVMVDRYFQSVNMAVVENDPDNQLFLREALKLSGVGCNIDFYISSTDLMNYLSTPGSSSPCCILVDLDIPEESGWEAMREIKTHPDFKKIPLLVMSGFYSEEDDNFCKSLGVAYYLVKAPDLDHLVGLFKKIETDYCRK